MQAHVGPMWAHVGMLQRGIFAFSHKHAPRRPQPAINTGCSYGAWFL